VDDLKKAGIEKADAFFAVTQGDNRNIMAAQIARTIFNVRKPVCRIYDPMRQEIYRGMGLDTISATAVITEMLASKLESAGA
jgi:trk system potassium uptake protein TrkA